MAIITLTTDWGTKDHYIGAVKGTILRQMPEATIVDITHAIPAFDLNQAAFIIRNFYKNFPAGSIHILAVNTEASIRHPHTLVKYEEHWFIGADNGIFSLIFDNKPELIIDLDVIQDSDYFTFSTRDVFAKVACHIASGKPAGELGVSYRHMAQSLGTEWARNLRRDFWLRIAAAFVVDQMDAGETHFVISDVRFANEAEWVRSKGGQIWRVHREGLASVRPHVSESGVDSIKPHRTIHNNGTTADLAEAVALAIESLT